MNDPPEPTVDLLSQLLGKRVAKRVYRGSPTDLFLDENVPEGAKARLRASRELVERLLLEDVRRQPVLEKPKTVREYLAVHYARHAQSSAGAVKWYRLAAAQGLGTASMNRGGPLGTGTERSAGRARAHTRGLHRAVGNSA